MPSNHLQPTYLPSLRCAKSAANARRQIRGRNICYLTLAVLGLISVCGGARAETSALSGLEQLVTCGESRAAFDAVEALQRSDGFEIDPTNKNFYTSTASQSAFGMKIRYVGLGGFGDYPGPNVSVEGRADALRKRLEVILGRKPKCTVEQICYWEHSSRQDVVVYTHPTNAALAVVHCAYQE